MSSDPGSIGEEVYRPAWEGSKTYISYGVPFPEACKRHATDTFKASRIYIIASGSLSRNTHHVKRLQDALGNRAVGTRYGMKPHTLWSEILQVAQEASSLSADLLVTLGAGSLTDGAKIIALVSLRSNALGAWRSLTIQAMANGAKTFEDLDTLHADSTSPKRDLQAPSVPIICIPTSLSGGEYNYRGGGSNDDTHRKYSFAHPGQRPALVILDPDLTTTTPDRWWLSSGIRAVDHCIEAMCSLNSPPECDADSSKGLKLLVPGLLKCKKSNQDLEARFSCQLGVIEAMKASSYGVPMGASRTYPEDRRLSRFNCCFHKAGQSVFYSYLRL